MAYGFQCSWVRAGPGPVQRRGSPWRGTQPGRSQVRASEHTPQAVARASVGAILDACRVTVFLSPATGLVVSNTGPRVEPDQVASLFEPFRRLTTDRTHKGDGAGLGLSIVAAIAAAHHATLNARANPEGGLTVTVEFASAASPVKENVIHRLPV